MHELVPRDELEALYDLAKELHEELTFLPLAERSVGWLIRAGLKLEEIGQKWGFEDVY